MSQKLSHYTLCFLCFFVSINSAESSSYGFIDSLTWGLTQQQLIEAHQSRDAEQIVDANLKIAHAFINKKMVDSAIIYLYGALAYTEMDGVSQEYLINTLRGLGNAYHMTANHTKASRYYQRAILAAEEAQDSLFRLLLLEYITISNEDGQFDQAISFLHDGSSVEPNLSTAGKKAKLFKVAYIAFANISDFEHSNIFKDSFLLYYDSLLQTDQQLVINKLTSAFKLKEQEAENQLLIAEKKQRELELANKNMFIMVLLFGLMTVLLLSILILRQYWQKRKYAAQLEIKVKEQTTELREKNQQLTAYNQEMERFTHIASHDLKEPLRSIISYLSLMDRQKGKPNQETKIQKYTALINKSAHQLHTLIKDILAFSRLQINHQIPLQKTDLNVVVDNIQQAISRKMEETSTILDYESLPVVVTNEQQLFLALKNIIENGIKYNESRPPIIHISYQKSEGEHHIFIKDNGIGIPQKYQQKIFDSFYRLHNKTEYEGSGLGLAIVQRTLQKLGGDISVKSKEGQGSTFVIRLPIVEKVSKRDLVLVK